MSQHAYLAAIEGAAQEKEQSLENPEGLIYMDHVWDMVKTESDLSVAIRAGSELHADVPIRAWWTLGEEDPEDPDDAHRLSTLSFEVPDEISRRVQSVYASDFMKKFFSDNSGVELDEAFTGSTADQNRNGFKHEPLGGPGVSNEIILGDWPKLKTAIEKTAADTGGYLGGRKVSVYGTAGWGSARARVENGNFELNLTDQTISGIQELWSKAFREEIGLV